MECRESAVEYRRQLGAAVRDLRKQQQLTQVQLGLIVGLDRSRISCIERGECSVSFDNLVLLANGLGVAPSDLLEGIAQPLSPEDPVPVSLSVPTGVSISYRSEGI